MRAALAAGFLVALASAGRGQTVEVTPVAGYRFGGGNVNTDYQGNFVPGAGFELDDSASFGLHVGYQLGGVEIELLYARQETHGQSNESFAGVPLFDMTLDIWQLGGNFFFRDETARLRPYLGAGLGLTHMTREPQGLSDENRFSASFAAGAKLRLGDHFGLRAEARGFFTVYGDNGSDYSCGTRGSCVHGGTSQLMTQVDLRAGLILAF
jgi:outer membrane protein W